MFQPTANPYRFQYLVTSFSGGAGLECVYLPPRPQKRSIAGWDQKTRDQKWERTPLPEDWKKWRREEKLARAKDPGFIHPKINAFIRQEWDRRLNGYWLYINNTAVYLTGAYYYYLNWWRADFGYPKFRANDMEVWYFARFCEEDPNCYGPMYNTRRRSGKSAIMGCWQVEGVSRHENCYGGIQGESEKKVKPFFNLAIVQPFKKLPDFFQPVYDTNSTQKASLDFFAPVTRGRQRGGDDDEDPEELESWINWMGGDIFAYDGRKIHYGIIEEPGKTTEVDVRERHDIIKPCCEEDDNIIGKWFYGTTVEEMETAGAVYEKLAKESDYDDRQENGQTISGLYFSFMPSPCNYIWDDFGFPLIEEATQKLILKREAQRKDPTKYAATVRKYPFNVREAFYRNANKCVFNAQILQDRATELMTKKNATERGYFDTVDPKDIHSRVVWVPDRVGGKWQISWIPTEDADTNLIEETGSLDGVRQYKPRNNARFGAGTDPIQYGVTTDQGRASKPVAFFKRKYDANVDGPLDENVLRERATEVWEHGKRIKDKYQYQTGLNIAMYDYRPQEPKEYYKQVLLACRFFGCAIQIETQKAGGLMGYFDVLGYAEFIQTKVVLTPDPKKQAESEKFLGTASTRGVINDYTGLLATDVVYFGHCYRFKEQCDDMLVFNPKEPTKHDYTVAAGFTELSLLKEVAEERPPLDLNVFLRTFDNRGTLSRVVQ